MALTQCPECGGKLSDSAEVCPHCGFRLKPAPPLLPMFAWDRPRFIAWGIVMAIVVAIIYVNTH